MKQITIECTKCSNLITVAAEEAVNATRNEDVKKRVIMKRIFEARCPKCQNIHFVTRPFLYQDNEKHILYVLATEGMDIDRFVKKQNVRGNYKKQYTLRVTHSINQLVEKILLAEYGINDKAMEVLKLFFVMGEKNSNIRNVYFEGLEGSRIRLAVIMNDGRQLLAYADMRGLERITAINKKMLNETKNDWEDINVKWAMNFYDANEKEINRIGALVAEEDQKRSAAIKAIVEKSSAENSKPVAKKTKEKKTSMKVAEKKSVTKSATKKATETKAATKKVAEKKPAAKSAAKKTTETKTATKKVAEKKPVAKSAAKKTTETKTATKKVTEKKPTKKTPTKKVADTKSVKKSTKK